MFTACYQTTPLAEPVLLTVADKKGEKTPGSAKTKMRTEQRAFFLCHTVSLSVTFFFFFFSVSSSYQLLSSVLKQHLCLEETYP